MTHIARHLWRVLSEPAMIEVQRQELLDALESGTLRNHALEVLQKAYANGVRQAVAETGLPEADFPEEKPLTLDDLLSCLLDGDDD